MCWRLEKQTDGAGRKSVVSPPENSEGGGGAGGGGVRWRGKGGGVVGVVVDLEGGGEGKNRRENI